MDRRPPLPKSPEELKKFMQEIKDHGHVLSDGERVVKESLEKMRGTGRILLNTPEGQALMADLETQFFNGDLIASQPEHTYYMLGKRDVVRYMMMLRDSAKEE